MTVRKNKDLVSAVIVNWNGKKWLEKCLTSLSNQTYKDLEIIVVDNASLDDSVEYIKRNFPNVRIIRNKGNFGFARGNNIGIGLSRGKIILRIDSDAWVEEDFVEKIHNFYTNNNYDVVAPRERTYDKRMLSDKYGPIDFLGNPAFGTIIKRDKPFALSGVCLFFPKKLYQDTKGFDGDFFMYYEDVDWFWRLQLLEKKFAICNDVFVYHSGTGSSEKGLNYKMFLWRNQNNLQMLLKNYSFLSLFFVLPFYFLQNFFEIILFLVLLKPKLAYSYIDGWIFNFKNIKRTLRKRQWIQKNRIVGDLAIVRNMYPIPLRLVGLVNRI